VAPGEALLWLKLGAEPPFRIRIAESAVERHR